MKYYDIIAFDAEKKLQQRLGFTKMYTVGKDVMIHATPKQSGIPVIIKSKDQGAIIRYMKDPGVCGIIFEDNFLSRKTIEKAAEAKKTIFIPTAHLQWHSVSDRHAEIKKIKQILSAAHSLKAKAALVSLAENKESLLSRDQMAELSRMIFDTRNSKFSIFGGELYDN